MRLGMAVRGEHGQERRMLVAPLPSDPALVVDLHAVEGERLRKLGEGDPFGMAQALVPPSLRRLLEGGHRAFLRARQALAYAEKWARRGGLPERLAFPEKELRLLPCLSRPASLRYGDGSFGDRLQVRGSGERLPWSPDLDLQATLALLGQSSAGPAGCCLALLSGTTTILGPWLHEEAPLEGNLRLATREERREAPLEPYADLVLPRLRPGEVFLLPPPRWAPLVPLPGDKVKLAAAFDSLSVSFGREGTHPTLQ